VLILFGIACQLIQLYVSVRDRNQNLDVTGDPWNGHTLEWSTSSPPPFYNFAHMPEKVGLDAWHEAKENGVAYKAGQVRSDPHAEQHRHRSVHGLFLTVFGFALIWHIWWLVGASLLAPSRSSFATLHVTTRATWFRPKKWRASKASA
jgi:cytochrome o ubiquinol oxidase subunit 1